MKKFLSLAVILSLILVLAACGATPQDPPENEPTTVPAEEIPLELSIEWLEDYDIVDFTYVFNYSEYLAEPPGDTLLIRANQPLRDFALVFFANEAEGTPFPVINRIGELDELPVGEGFVITNYHSSGTVFASGIAFVDTTGGQRYFAIVQDQSDEFPERYRLIELTAPDWINTHENEFNLTVELLEYEEGPGPLGDLDFMHMLNYTDVMEARDGTAHEDFGDSLLITTEVPLRDFAVLLFSNDVLGDDLIFVPMETFGEIDELAPGEGFIIQNYRAHGTMPWSGVTFMDEEGVQRYFALWQTQSGLGKPYYLVEFENRAGELPPEQPAEETTAPPANAALALTIERLQGSTAGFTHVFDYSLGYGVSDGTGDALLIQANLPLRNFGVLFFENDMLDDEVIFIPSDIFGLVEELAANEGFVITNYLNRGTMIASGITFLDAEGAQRLFGIVQDQSDEFPEQYRLIEFENRTGEVPAVWHFAR